LGIPDRASVDVVVVSDVVFYGGGQSLSVSEYGGAIGRERI
jgi:hypothetical protein